MTTCHIAFHAQTKAGAHALLNGARCPRPDIVAWAHDAIEALDLTAEVKPGQVPWKYIIAVSISLSDYSSEKPGKKGTYHCIEDKRTVVREVVAA